jgi:siroheme synthase
LWLPRPTGPGIDELREWWRRRSSTSLAASQAHPVGKTGRGPSCKQGEIDAQMVQLAKSGKRVVRPKAGDPLIFGRRRGDRVPAASRRVVSTQCPSGISVAVVDEGSAKAAKSRSSGRRPSLA